jgi:hypothetical protein
MEEKVMRTSKNSTSAVKIFIIFLLTQLLTGCNLKKKNDFVFEKSFEITVPQNFYDTAWFENFKNEDLKNFLWYDPEIIKALTNKNLTPGKKYEVQIYRPLKVVTPEECLSFIKSKGTLAGANGLALVWQRAREQIYDEMISFFDENKLSRSQYHYHLPVIVRERNPEAWRFEFNFGTTKWGEQTQIICFREK